MCLRLKTLGHNNNLIGSVVAYLMLLLFVTGPAQAITLDEFTAEQSLFATVPGQIQISVLPHTSVMGGFRTLKTSLSGGSNTFTGVSISGGILQHSQANSAQAVSEIIWDGDADAMFLNSAGLGGLNLRDDGATQFRIRVVSFDYPFNQGLPLTITVYDARGMAGEFASSATLIINESIEQSNPRIFGVPFSAFVATGTIGGADFTNVGAIKLFIDGQAPAVDLSLSALTTDGRCNLVPRVGQDIVDECGVCGGDNSSCLDCRGIPNGPAMPGATCQTGRPGMCSAGAYSQNCQCVAISTPSAELCDGLDNDCDGAIDEDCGGCVSIDQEDLLALLDLGAKIQETIIITAARHLRQQRPKNQAVRAYITRTLNEAHELQLRNWVLSWTLPVESLVCTQMAVCTSVSMSPLIEEYRSNAKRLLSLARGTLNRLKGVSGGRLKARDRRLEQQAKYYFDDNITKLANVSTVQSSCR